MPEVPAFYQLQENLVHRVLSSAAFARD